MWRKHQKRDLKRAAMSSEPQSLYKYFPFCISDRDKSQSSVLDYSYTSKLDKDDPIAPLSSRFLLYWLYIFDNAKNRRKNSDQRVMRVWYFSATALAITSALRKLSFTFCKNIGAYLDRIKIPQPKSKSHKISLVAAPFSRVFWATAYLLPRIC